MFMNPGDVVLLSHRRIFQNDEPRYFLGRVLESEGPLLKVTGFTFVRDVSNGSIVKKDEVRTKVLSLASPGYIVYQLPQDVDVDHADFRNYEGEAVLMDGERELMNLSEHTHCGHF